MHEVHVTADTDRKFFEFLSFKQLIYFVTWREFKARYKQTALGILWTVLQPLLFAGVVAILLFRRGEFDFGFDGVSNIVAIFIGFVLWQFFEGSFSGATNSLLSNQALIKKVYFPRMVLLISSILTRFIDFFLAFFVFLVLLVVSGSEFHASGFLYVIPGLLILAMTALAVALLLAPMNIQFRDVRLVLPFFTRLLFFSSPIWYPFSFIPEKIQEILLFNPVVSVIELVRNGLFAPAEVDATLLYYPLITLSVLLIIGIPYFRRKEGKLADYL